MEISKIVKGFKFKSIGKALGLKDHLSKTDFGVLKVAFMVAALDGVVSDEEYAAFDALAKKCRGYTEESAAQALDEALRSAGYLMLLARRVTDGVLVRAFIAEAKKALPDGFAHCSVEDVRRALVMWIAMGMSDGDYSKRERKCIEALRRNFAEIRVSRLLRDEERWLAMSAAYRTSAFAATEAAGGTVQFVSETFVDRVEKLVAAYDADSDAAAKELQKLIAEAPAAD